MNDEFESFYGVPAPDQIPAPLSNAELIRLEAERFKKLVDHWCPENLLHEGFPNTLMRAFLSATACAADQKRKLDGLDTIRPLESYPDPMFGFKNTQSGF